MVEANAIDEAISIRIEKFKSNLHLSEFEVVEQFVFSGDPYAISNDTYYKLKRKIADKFGISTAEVMLVGSGKLGFTTVDRMDKEGSIYRPAFSPYAKKDFDVAIVSSRLFDRYWSLVYDYSLKNGKPSENFTRYLFNGWIRPDHFPYRLPGKKDWFEFFEQLSSDREYGVQTINAGIYKDWEFLITYQTKSIKILKRS